MAISFFHDDNDAYFDFDYFRLSATQLVSGLRLLGKARSGDKAATIALDRVLALRPRV